MTCFDGKLMQLVFIKVFHLCAGGQSHKKKDFVRIDIVDA